MAMQKASKGGGGNFPTSFKFTEAGHTLKGYYQGQIEKTINGRKAIEHTYKTPTGLVSVLGQADILSQLNNNGISPGTYVEITFSGSMKKLKSGNTLKQYDIVFDSEDVSLEEAASDDSEDSEEESDTVAWVAPKAPSSPAKAPSVDAQARVNALLNKGKSSNTTKSA